MGKTKSSDTSERRTSLRLAGKTKAAPVEIKKRVVKRAAKPKAKPAENGSKAEEPKAEAAEAK